MTCKINNRLLLWILITAYILSIFNEKNPIKKMYNCYICFDILFLCCFPLLGVILAYYSWKHIEKRSIKIQNTFAESSKEGKYEESCLRCSYSHNDHLSRKPIVQ